MLRNVSYRDNIGHDAPQINFDTAKSQNSTIQYNNTQHLPDKTETISASVNLILFLSAGTVFTVGGRFSF